MNNILVTGGCGFIASNFLNYMIKKYDRYNFINIDAMYYCANEKHIIKSNRNKKNYRQRNHLEYVAYFTNFGSTKRLR